MQLDTRKGSRKWDSQGPSLIVEALFTQSFPQKNFNGSITSMLLAFSARLVIANQFDSMERCASILCIVLIDKFAKGGFIKNMRKWSYFAVAFCFCALVIGVLTWNSNTSSGSTTTEEYYQKVRNGLAEISIPTNNNINSINAAPDSLSNFIYYRSGVQISSLNKNTLRSAEQDAWSTSKRVDATTLTQIITDITIERIPTLSDSEIARITESSRGFSSPDLPASFDLGRQKVKLRASGLGRMSAD